MAKEDNLFEEKAEGTKPAVNADKLKALRAAMEKIEKNYGKGSIMKSTARNHPVRRRWPSMPSPKHRKPVVLPPSLMQNMPSTVSMPRSWVWM